PEIHPDHDSRNGNQSAGNREQLTDKNTYAALFPKHLHFFPDERLLRWKFAEVPAQHGLSAEAPDKIQKPASYQSGQNGQNQYNTKMNFSFGCPDTGKRHDDTRREPRQIEVFQKNNQKNKKCSIL